MQSYQHIPFYQRMRRSQVLVDSTYIDTNTEDTIKHLLRSYCILDGQTEGLLIHTALSINSNMDAHIKRLFTPLLMRVCLYIAINKYIPTRGEHAHSFLFDNPNNTRYLLEEMSCGFYERFVEFLEGIAEKKN